MAGESPHTGEPDYAGWVGRGHPLRASDPAHVGPYQILSLLGVGGMGSVYLGRSPGGRAVAVKVVRADLAADSRFLRMFHREATLARRVARFCTAEVLDMGDVDGRPYLVTEYVDGPTLWDAVARDGPLDGARLERIAVAVATALTAIHSAGMVHRDLKPANVMLSEAGPLVIDFGIAHALEGTTHLTQGSYGTPAFMAPEQARGDRVDASADIFAWGGIVVFAATGRPPFGTGRPEALLYRVVHEAPDLDGVPTPLRTVVAEAMRPHPADRPSAQQLYARLLSLSAADRTAEAAGTVAGQAGAGTRRPTAEPPPRSESRSGSDFHADSESRSDSDVGSGVAASPPHFPLPSPSRSPLSPPPSSQLPPSQLPHSPLSPPPVGDRVGSGIRRGPAAGADVDTLRSTHAEKASTPAIEVVPARRRQRRGVARVMRRRWVALPVAVAAAAALGIALVSQFATTDRDIDAISRRLAVEALRIRAEEPELARRLAVAAYATAPTTEARRSLFATVDPVLATLDTGGTADLAFSPNGDILATTGRDNGTVRFWNVADPANTPGQPLSTHDGHVGLIEDLAFNPDGTMLATGGIDTAIRIWDVTAPSSAGRPLATLTGHTDSINNIVFSPAPGVGMLATASLDGTARLWDTTSPASSDQPLAVVTSHADIHGIMFSPDGTILATTSTSGDRTVRLWDASRPRSTETPLAVLTGSTAPVDDLAFSPPPGAQLRGRPLPPPTLATDADDGTVRLWDVDVDVTDPGSAGEPVATFTGHTDWIYNLEFSPDGMTLATTGADGVARLWDVDPRRAASRACADRRNWISTAEWERYVPELPYDAPCEQPLITQ